MSSQFLTLNIVSMSTSMVEAVATPAGERATHALPARRPHRIVVRIARSLWLRERGVAELRWAAVTLATMALLALVATALDPVGGDFVRVMLLAAPAAVLVGVAGWGPAASRIGRSMWVRMLLGPAVLLVAIIGAGPADIVALRLPPAASLSILAMAYAAITPGYLIAAAIFSGTTLAIFIAHVQVTPAVAPVNQATDGFTVRAIVTILASAGIAVVVRIATEAESRANRLAARSRERVDALEALNRIVSRFDGTRSVRSVIQEVVDDIAREFDITLVSMYLPDANGRLEMVGVAGYDNPFHVIEMGVGIIGRAASTKTTQFAPDVLADPDYRAARADVRSEVASPVVHLDEVLGVVNFEGTEEAPIGPTQVALAEMVVHSLAGALRSARLDDERRDRLRAIERVLAVSRELVADLDRPRIVASVVDVAAELLTADVVALFSRGADGAYRLEAGSGFPASAIGLEVRGRRGMVGRCIEERVRIDGLQEIAMWPTEYIEMRPGGAQPHAAMALPILVADEVAAALFVTRVGAERTFTDLERGIADLLTAQVSIALQNADLHARVADSALHDPLTGLLNRRYFDEAVENAHANARRAKSELSLIVFDLDRFSAVNNEYGHSVGDSVLRRVARAIKGAVRDGDIVVRYGGEEFVVIAPNTDGEGAVIAAERIREAVAAKGLEPIDGRLVPLTISAGVASLVDEPDGRALFRAADSALLAAKRAGRDRVTQI